MESEQGPSQRRRVGEVSPGGSVQAPEGDDTLSPAGSLNEGEGEDSSPSAQRQLVLGVNPVARVDAFDFTAMMDDNLPAGIFESMGNQEFLPGRYDRGRGWTIPLNLNGYSSPITQQRYHPPIALINRSAPKPTARYEQITVRSGITTYSDAIYQRKHFVMEWNSNPHIQPSISPEIHPRHHTSNHTDSFLTFYRKERGCYMFCKANEIVHSEVLEANVPSVVRDGVQAGKKYIQVSSGVFNLGGSPFVLVNGRDPGRVIKCMRLEQIFHDLCLKPDGNNKWKILQRGTRGNRGVDIGRTGGRSQKLSRDTKIAEPSLAQGTDRYPALWVAGSDLLTILCNKAEPNLC